MQFYSFFQQPQGIRRPYVTEWNNSRIPLPNQILLLKHIFLFLEIMGSVSQNKGYNIYVNFPLISMEISITKVEWIKWLL